MIFDVTDDHSNCDVTCYDAVIYDITNDHTNCNIVMSFVLCDLIFLAGQALYCGYGPTPKQLIYVRFKQNMLMNLRISHGSALEIGFNFTKRRKIMHFKFLCMSRNSHHEIMAVKQVIFILLLAVYRTNRAALPFLGPPAKTVLKATHTSSRLFT